MSRLAGHDRQSDLNTHAYRRRDSAMLWLIVVLTAAAVVLSMRVVNDQVDRRLHDAVTKRLREMFPHLSVAIGRVTTPRAGEIIATDIKFHLRDGKSRHEVLSIQRCTCTGDLDVAHLIQQTIRIHQVSLDGVELSVWQLADGRWSPQFFSGGQTTGGKLPRTQLTGGVVRILQDRKVAGSGITLYDVTCEARTPQSLESLSESLRPIGVTPPATMPVIVSLQAKGGGVFDNLTANFELAADRQRWQILGDIAQLSFSRTLLARLPKSFSKYLEQVSGLECNLSAQYNVSSVARDQPMNFELRGQLTKGRLHDVRLPYPLEGLEGTFHCNPKVLQLRSMQAHSGKARFDLNTDIQGLGLDAPVVLDARVSGLELDARLYNSLPPNLQKFWNRLQLEGVVDANVVLVSDGQKWTPDVTINCRRVSFEPWVFPYRLSDVTGTVTYKDQLVSCEDMSGLAGGQVVRAAWSFTESAGQWFGRLGVSSDQAIVLDEKLLSALTPRDEPRSGSEQFVRALHPTGSVRVNRAVFERRPENPQFWHKEIDAQVYGCTIQYEGFRYPMYDVRGRIRARDSRWELSQFEGRNDSCRIQCSGEWQTKPATQFPVALKFRAFALPMEEELLRALPVDAQHMWEQLQPSGSIDNVEVSLSRSEGAATLNIEVAIHEEQKKNFETDQSLRFFPKPIPYLLSDVACDIRYRPGEVIIERASASNGDSRVAVSGRCVKISDNNWTSDIQWLPTTRMILDGQLLQALPESMRNFLSKLDVRGPISALGTSRFNFQPGKPQDLSSELNMQMDVEDVELGANKLASGIRGTIWLAGHTKPKDIALSGKLALDSLSVRGVPVSRLVGPYAIIGQQVYFGQYLSHAIPSSNPQQPQEMTAAALSGKIHLSGFGSLDTGKFQLQSSLEAADLSLMLQEFGVNHVPSQANCSANLDISGVPWNPQTYIGSGAIRLRDAKLFELPIMMRLLRTMSVSPVDGAAFHTADINFSIDGDRIPLQLAFDGDVLSLRGGGSANLRRELDLELYSYVSRRFWIPNSFAPLVADTRYAAFMMIEVNGSLDNPVMVKRPFPQLTSQQVFPDKISSSAKDTGTPRN